MPPAIDGMHIQCSLFQFQVTSEFTLNGLEPGDRVDVTSTLIDDNFDIWAVVSSAGKFTVKARNRSAGTLNPGTITYGVRGTKQRNG